jgi:hypothetical protein
MVLEILALIFGVIVGFCIATVSLWIGMGVAIFISIVWKRFPESKWKRFFSGLILGMVFAGILILLSFLRI